MHRHLVAVEVGVEGGTDQRVQLDRLAVDEHRVEGLDRKFVQRRRAVEHHGILVDDLLQALPHFVGLLLDHVFGRFEGRGVPLLLQFGQQMGLEELQRHVFGQTALIHSQVGADDDDRTAGEVDPFTQQVLAEATLFTFDDFAQRFQGALVGALDGVAATAVVKERIHRLLQHPLFVADDDFGRIQLHQTLQALIAVDDPAIEIVDVADGELPAV